MLVFIFTAFSIESVLLLCNCFPL